MRRIVLSFALACGLAAPVRADSLADVQRDIDVLLNDLAGLQMELTLSQDTAPTLSGSLIERVISIEQELQRLTGVTERLEFQIRQLGAKATVQMDDLRFRLCALDVDCDVDSLPITPQLLQSGETGDQDDALDVSAGPVFDTSDVSEQELADFSTVQAAFLAGDLSAVRGGVDQFLNTHANSALTQQALLLRGQAEREDGAVAKAGQTFLSAYVENTQTDVAADALLNVATTLHQLGKTEEACLTLSEVSNQFPNAPAAQDAEDARAEFDCE